MAPRPPQAHLSLCESISSASGRAGNAHTLGSSDGEASCDQPEATPTQSLGVQGGLALSDVALIRISEPGSPGIPWSKPNGSKRRV